MHSFSVCIASVGDETVYKHVHFLAKCLAEKLGFSYDYAF